MEDHTQNPRSTCVVIGGQGFIGKFLVLRLLRLGNWIVRIADLSPSLDVEQQSPLFNAVSDGRASYFHVDVRDMSQLLRALDGSSVVFFVEANYASCGAYECYKFIVQGTKNVVNACRQCKVKQLIYNSSADVVFDGTHHIRRGDESMRYPWKYEDMLTEMKAQAETLILSANNYDGLLTCAIRPSNVFGPADTHIVHALVNRTNSSWAKFTLGNGDCLSEFTYVENVAHAHICAAEALVSCPVSVAGKAFFITNFEPRNYWQFVSRIHEGLQYQRPCIRIPHKVVSFMLPLVRWMRYTLGPDAEVEEVLASTQFAIESSLFTRTFDCSAAREHIKYSPIVLMEEGIALTVKSFIHLAKDVLPSREIRFRDISKAEEILGYGKVADILLWRDEMETFTCFLSTVGLFYWFFLSGRTFISSTVGLLLIATFFIIIDCVLPFNIFQKLSLPRFEVSETTVQSLLEYIACVWNEGVNIVKSVARGEDWSLFLKTAVPLYFLKLIISHSFAMLVGAVLIFAFTSFFIYEQYEEEIDWFCSVIFIIAKTSMTLLLNSLPDPIASFFFPDDDELDEEELAQPASKE